MIGTAWTRTRITEIKNLVLFQLSYVPVGTDGENCTLTHLILRQAALLFAYVGALVDLPRVARGSALSESAVMSISLQVVAVVTGIEPA